MLDGIRQAPPPAPYPARADPHALFSTRSGTSSHEGRQRMEDFTPTVLPPTRTRRVVRGDTRMVWTAAPAKKKPLHPKCEAFRRHGLPPLFHDGPRRLSHTRGPRAYSIQYVHNMIDRRASRPKHASSGFAASRGGLNGRRVSRRAGSTRRFRAEARKVRPTGKRASMPESCRKFPSPSAAPGTKGGRGYLVAARGCHDARQAPGPLFVVHEKPGGA